MRTTAIRRSLALVFTLSALPALAQDTTRPAETVEVSASTLIGVWKFRVPQGFGFHLFSKTEWEPNADEYCQIEKIRSDLTVHCLGLRMGSKDVSRGTVSINGSHIRMHWGSMVLYAAINGSLRSMSQFEGTFSIQVMGITSDAPDKATGTKLTLSANTPDKGGKSALLMRVLNEMSQGALTVPFDGHASAVKILKPDTLRAMGSIQSVIFLGEITFKQKSSEPVSNSVYDIEFGNGHLICELRESADGKLEHFDCG